MNIDFLNLEYKTPQKAVQIQSRHYHNYSQPLFESKYPEQYEQRTNLTKSGLQTLKKWDFFSDPFSLPEKYLSSPQIKIKTETTDLGFDSLDFMMGKQTDRYSSTSLQLLHDKAQSEKNIGKKVKFSDLVQVKKDDGSESEEPISTQSRKEARKSKFSTSNQRPPLSVRKYC